MHALACTSLSALGFPTDVDGGTWWFAYHLVDGTATIAAVPAYVIASLVMRYLTVWVSASKSSFSRCVVDDAMGWKSSLTRIGQMHHGQVPGWQRILTASFVEEKLVYLGDFYTTGTLLATWITGWDAPLELLSVGRFRFDAQYVMVCTTIWEDLP